MLHEVDRDQRRVRRGFAPDQREPRRDRRCDFDRGDRALAAAVREDVDADEEEAEGQRVQRRAGPVEPARRAVGIGQRAPGHHEVDDADRHVDREQPLPGADGENRRGDGRPDRGGDRHHQRVQPDTAAEQGLRIGEADQRAVDAEDPGGAEALRDPRGDQLRHGVGERAAERARGEDRQADEVDAAIADPLAERGAREQRDHDRELIGVDDPDRLGRARVKFGGDDRQRNVGDRRVEHGHRDAERDRKHRPVALRRRQAVGMHRLDQNPPSALGAATRRRARARPWAPSSRDTAPNRRSKAAAFATTSSAPTKPNFQVGVY